jgi:hypothetical protein
MKEENQNNDNEEIIIKRRPSKTETPAPPSNNNSFDENFERWLSRMEILLKVLVVLALVTAVILSVRSLTSNNADSQESHTLLHSIVNEDGSIRPDMITNSEYFPAPICQLYISKFEKGEFNIKLTGKIDCAGKSGEAVNWTYLDSYRQPYRQPPTKGFERVPDRSMIYVRTKRLEEILKSSESITLASDGTESDQVTFIVPRSKFTK